MVLRKRPATQKVPMQTVFAQQLDPTAFTRDVSFIIMEDDGRDTVSSCSKKKLETIEDQYEYVSTEKGRLPRFIRK